MYYLEGVYADGCCAARKKEREEEVMEEDKAQYRTAGNKSGSRNITNK